MHKSFKWKTNDNGNLVSEDGYITIYQRDEIWIMDDHLEDESVEYSNKKECMDEAGKRMLITQLGDFYVFIEKVDMEHQIIH